MPTQSGGRETRRTLELTSAAREYPKRGKYKITLNVIDSFGNDTTKVEEVTI